MKSIRKRLVGDFMFIIIITVVILEVLFIYIVRQNYYKNLEGNLTSQVMVASDLYYKYFSDSTLADNVINNVDTFWKQTTAQVEIVDTTGNVIMDSIGVMPDKTSQMEDVKSALKGKKGKWIGNMNSDSEGVMIVSYPLESGSKIVGVIRFISSLSEVNKDLHNIAYIFISIGLVVIFSFGVVSLFLANSIIGPLKEVTEAAEKMAKGNLKFKSKKRANDEIGKLSDTLNFMASEILNKEQLKNEFIASVSHELRTPLTSIKGWAVTMKDKNFRDEETIDDGLNIIETECDRLTNMVEELLDFSKFVSGKVTVTKDYINIPDLMEYMKVQLNPRAFKENINFITEYKSDLPEICTDKNRLKQVFNNILDNAFNFTSNGGTVTFTAILEDNEIIFNIQDTGCGISIEEIPKVKEKFYKGKSSKSRNGIGLSICEEILQLLDGSFIIESILDEGTRVIIRLPL